MTPSRAMTATCPKCEKPAELPEGASRSCARCKTDFWGVPGEAQGEAFTGALQDQAGTLAVAWTVIAAVGVLAALLGILAAEVWGVTTGVRALLT